MEGGKKKNPKKGKKVVNPPRGGWAIKPAPSIRRQQKKRRTQGKKRGLGGKTEQANKSQRMGYEIFQGGTKWTSTAQNSKKTVSEGEGSGGGGVETEYGIHSLMGSKGCAHAAYKETGVVGN